MKERDILNVMIKQAKKEVTNGYYIHKDGDTYGGHKKPYDFYIVYEGRHFAVEVKLAGEDLTDFQKESLKDVEFKGGGYSFTAYIQKNKDIVFKVFSRPLVLYNLKWINTERGYADLKELPFNLMAIYYY